MISTRIAEQREQERLERIKQRADQIVKGTDAADVKRIPFNPYPMKGEKVGHSLL